jgi:hypothetical protein
MARMQGAAKGATSKPAVEKAAPAAKPAPADGAKKSTADILAAARANKAAAASAPPAAPISQPVADKSAPAAPTVAPPKPAAAKPALAPGQRPSISEILAWCRQHDSK